MMQQRRCLTRAVGDLSGVQSEGGMNTSGTRRGRHLLGSLILIWLAQFSGLLWGQLPTPWSNQNIGSPGAGTGSSYSSGVFTVSGSGCCLDGGNSDTFQFANQTLKGKLPTGGIAISENVTTRYLLPVGIAVLAMFVIAYEARKMARPSAPASPK